VTDSTVALVREKLKMMADEPTYHGIVCGKALALIERQQRELAAAIADARRYRWLRDGATPDQVYDCTSPGSLYWDDLIDAAIAASEGET
jgi:hypothetical protein